MKEIFRKILSWAIGIIFLLLTIILFILAHVLFALEWMFKFLYWGFKWSREFLVVFLAAITVGIQESTKKETPIITISEDKSKAIH